MRVAVVGSGPAGVAAASILLATGVEVDVYDGGRSLEYSGQRLAEVSRSYVQSGRPLPETVIQNLHWGAKRPRLSAVLSAAVNQSLASRIGNQPLSKPLFGSDFVFADVAAELPSQGSWLPMSLATGGMSNIWGAACYPLRASDYQDWPIDEETMAPWYTKAAAFLGIADSHLGQSPDYALYPPAPNR